MLDGLTEAEVLKLSVFQEHPDKNEYKLPNQLHVKGHDELAWSFGNSHVISTSNIFTAESQ